MSRPTGLDGRIVFVTGAAGGIGAAVVRQLREEGALVCATDLAQAADLHPDMGIEPLDVTDSAAVDAAVDRVEREWGPIDHAVNVAGILATGPALDISDSEWRRVFDVNTHGLFHVCRAVGRHMRGRGQGSMVAVGSNAAGVPRHSMAAYAASKAAAHMTMRCLGLELGAHGIRCNIVAPGSTLTPMQTGMWQDESGAQAVIEGSLESYKTGIPLGKLATPDDVADTVIFLLSDRATHITMADIYVDGGATQRA